VEMDEDRVYKILKLTALVLFIIIAICILTSISCRIGFCAKNPEKCGVKKEGYDHPLDVDHIGAYHQIGSVGDGPRFQLYHGAGEYVFQPGASGYTGIYGDSRIKGGEFEAEIDPKMTPDTPMYCGYLNASNIPPGCPGCSETDTYPFCAQKCGTQKRGCPERYNEYSYWPKIMAAKPTPEPESMADL